MTEDQYRHFTTGDGKVIYNRENEHEWIESNVTWEDIHA